MALIESLLVIVIIIIIIVIVINVFFGKSNLLISGIIPAEQSPFKIDGKKLPENVGSDFAWAVWFYIDNWNTNYGETKTIFYQSPTVQNNKVYKSPSGEEYDGKYVDFGTFLDKYENNLWITITTMAEYPSAPLNQSTPYYEQLPSPLGQNYRYEAFKITNIDLQKWMCLIVSIDNRTLDIYLQGKLVRTFVLSNTVPQWKDNIYIGDPTEYFGGHIARLQYFANALNPQQAYNIYRGGIQSDLMSNFFNKYRLSIQFMEYETAVGDPLVI